MKLLILGAMLTFMISSSLAKDTSRLYVVALFVNEMSEWCITCDISDR